MMGRVRLASEFDFLVKISAGGRLGGHANT
jgi:hypothetical protein